MEIMTLEEALEKLVDQTQKHNDLQKKHIALQDEHIKYMTEYRDLLQSIKDKKLVSLHTIIEYNSHVMKFNTTNETYYAIREMVCKLFEIDKLTYMRTQEKILLPGE